MSLLPRPTCGRQISGQSNAGQLSALVRPSVKLHCVVVRLGHAKSFGSFILRESHVLAPTNQFVCVHACSCFDTKIAQKSRAELTKQYHGVSLREKFGTQQGNHPAFLRRATP